MKNKKVLYLTQLAVLVALLFIMQFTPLGYLKIGAIEITFMTIPVIIGAIVLGPTAGAILGFVFGMTSFMQCFGMSAFGSLLLSMNPFYTFIICVVSRTLMGFLTGLIFKGLTKIDKTKFISYTISSVCGALLNTVLFTGLILILFWPAQETKQYTYIPYTAEADGTYSFSTRYAIPQNTKGDVYLDLFTTDYETSYSTLEYDGVTYHESQYEFLGNGSPTIWFETEAKITKDLKTGEKMLIGLTDNNGVAFFDKVDVKCNGEIVDTIECEDYYENYGSSFKNQGRQPTVLNTLEGYSGKGYTALNNANFTGTMKSWGLPIDNIWVFILAFVGINGLIEAIVCAILGTAISKALMLITTKNSK